MSVNIFDFATDRTAEVKGVEKDWNGAKVVVARANNKEYISFLSKKFETHKKVIEDKTNEEASEKLAEEINKEAFCKFILVGWSGFVGKDNKALPYNYKNACAIYDAVPDLVRDVRVMAAEDENYRVKGLEKDAEDIKK